MSKATLYDLRSYLDVLKRDGDLLVIDEEVDPYLEIAEIHRRVIAQGGPALLFSKVKGSTFPVVTNLFGTNKRLEQAFGGRPPAVRPGYCPSGRVDHALYGRKTLGKSPAVLRFAENWSQDHQFRTDPRKLPKPGKALHSAHADLLA